MDWSGLQKFTELGGNTMKTVKTPAAAASLYASAEKV